MYKKRYYRLDLEDGIYYATMIYTNTDECQEVESDLHAYVKLLDNGLFEYGQSKTDKELEIFNLLEDINNSNGYILFSDKNNEKDKYSLSFIEFVDFAQSSFKEKLEILYLNDLHVNYIWREIDLIALVSKKDRIDNEEDISYLSLLNVNLTNNNTVKKISSATHCFEKLCRCRTYTIMNFFNSFNIPDTKEFLLDLGNERIIIIGQVKDNRRLIFEVLYIKNEETEEYDIDITERILIRCKDNSWTLEDYTEVSVENEVGEIEIQTIEPKYQTDNRNDINIYASYLLGKLIWGMSNEEVEEVLNNGEFVIEI